MAKNRQTITKIQIKKKNKKAHRCVVAAALSISMGLLLTSCGEKKTENELAYRKIGMNAMAAGDYEEAINNFQLALNQSKGQIRNLELDICMQKSEALYRNGQAEDAIAVCDAVLDYDKSYADAYYLRGNLYLQQGDSNKALADYEQAAKYADADRMWRAKNRTCTGLSKDRYQCNGRRQL